MLEDYFNGKQLNRTANADQAVAEGAATLARMLMDGEELSFEDVTPLSIGIEIWDGTDELMDVIVPKNTAFPIQKTERYLTVKDNQTTQRLKILQGEAEKAADCTVLGDIWIRGLVANTKGMEGADVTFAITASG